MEIVLRIWVCSITTFLVQKRGYNPVWKHVVRTKQTLHQPARQFWESAEEKTTSLASSKRCVERSLVFSFGNYQGYLEWSLVLINIIKYELALASVKSPSSVSKQRLPELQGWMGMSVSRPWVTAQSRSGNLERVPWRNSQSGAEREVSQSAEWGSASGILITGTGDKKGHIWELSNSTFEDLRRLGANIWWKVCCESDMVCSLKIMWESLGPIAIVMRGGEAL